MHVASTTLFEGPAPAYDELREHIAARLHLVPRFRQKLRFVPFGQGRPRWVDDPQFNLGYHIRHTALPSPGSEEQLRILAARIFSQRLDRSKPVWEMWLVDGVAGGRFALVTKSHHCLVDGVSGVDITTVLFDTKAEPTAVPGPEPWVPRPEPSGAEVLAEALLERATTPAEMVRGARAVFRAPRKAVGAGVEGWRPPAPSPERRRGPLLALQRPDRPLQALRHGQRRPRRLQGGSRTGGRDGQRRRARGRLRSPRPLPTLAWPFHHGPRAAGDGPDQRPRG